MIHTDYLFPWREADLMIFIFLTMFFTQLVLFCCLFIFFLLIQQNSILSYPAATFLAKLRIIFLFSSLQNIFSKTELLGFFLSLGHNHP